MLILPDENTKSQDDCQRLKGAQNSNFPSTMVKTQDISSASNVISLEKVPFLVLPLKEQLPEKIQSPILGMAVSESQSPINIELEASTAEDSVYEPGSDLESDSATDVEINLAEAESDSVSVDKAPNIPFDGDAHKEKKRKNQNQGKWKTTKNKKKLRMEGDAYLGYRRTQ